MKTVNSYRIQLWSRQSGEERWNNSPHREPDGPLLLQEHRTCKTPPEEQGVSRAPGRQRDQLHQSNKGLQTVLSCGKQIEYINFGLFQDASFAGDMRDSKSMSRGVLCVFGSHTFVPFWWMCKKQTAVSHSNAESENISPDASLRMGGLPALQFGECVLETLSSKQVEGNLERHTSEKVILSHSHVDKCVFWVNWRPAYHPTIPTIHTQPNSAKKKTMRQ